MPRSSTTERERDPHVEDRTTPGARPCPTIEDPIPYGTSFTGSYVTDVYGVVQGGQRRRTDVLGILDAQLTIDLASIGWSNAIASLRGLATHGRGPSRDVGDFQGTNGNEGPDGALLLEAWIEQRTADGTASLRAGLYDLSTEFACLPSAQLFVHGSAGTEAAFGTSGLNGPSAFPVTSLAARLEIRPTPFSYLRGVVADGVPGSLDEPGRTRVRFDDGDGVLLAAELGLLPEASSNGPHLHKLAVGVWGYAGTEFDDLSRPMLPDGSFRTRRGGSGAYLIGELGLFHEADTAEQGLSMYWQASVADSRVQPIRTYLGSGLVYRGALPSRPTDDVGLAVTAARFGEDFQRTAFGPTSRGEDWEVGLEFTYRADITPWFSLQPDVQYVVNPGGDPTLDDALILGMRAAFSF